LEIRIKIPAEVHLNEDLRKDPQDFCIKEFLLIDKNKFS